MRRSLAIAAALVALVGPLQSTAAAAPPATFVFAGSGFGHGVGMSQYGAYGQALEGRTVTQILQHYYTGAAVAPVDDSGDIRVNLVHAAPGGALYVRGETLGGGGGAIQLTGGAAPIDAGPDDAFQLGLDGANVTVARPGGPVLATAPTITVLWSGGPTLLDVAGPGDTFESAGHRYRYGALEVVAAGTALEAVNVLKLHGEYLRGIAEMPSSWPPAALQSQVVAARTYALRKRASGVRAECRCHVFDTVADQVFAGWVKESDAAGPRWVAAVDATSPGPTTGLAVLSGGQPISANYFSSSGGRTENNEEAFGGTALPYLRSVDDHWSLSSFNPNAAWSRTKSQADVAAAFQLPDVVSIDLSRRTAGGAVASAVALSSTGASATLAGGVLRSRLGLPGAWLRKPVVRVAGDDRYATSVAIGQVAAGAGDAVVVASGDGAHLVDGLVAGPLARAKAAPLLLSAVDALPGPVAAEIDRRHPATAYLVGGTAALGQGVDDALRAHGVATVTRLSGADRYETSLAVAREVGGAGGQAVLASGDPSHLVDALAAGGPAARAGFPVLLTGRDAVPPPTATALSELAVTATVVVGGSTAISDAVVGSVPSPHRDAGPDRYATALALADDFAGLVGVDQVVVASAADTHLVDALAAGALGRITLLSAPDALPASTRGWLERRVDLGGVQVVGGAAAVGDAAFAAVQKAIGG